MPVPPFVSPDASVHNLAMLGEGVSVGSLAHVGSEVSIGPRSTIGPEVDIGDLCIIGADVVIGQRVRIGQSALILQGAKVCPNPVRSVSSDGRTLLSHVTVGPDVLLHDEVELGSGAVVPSQATIAMIGNFGSKNRVVTIYGSDEGPRYSIGCQIGVDFHTVRSHVADGTNTTAASSGTYTPFLGVFSEIGRVVQTAYDKEARHVEDLRALRTANFI